MTRQRWIYFAISIIAGFGLGLLYAWVISPVQYVNTSPDTLRADFRTDYVLSVAEVFQRENNVNTASERLAILGSQPPAQIAASALAYARQYNYSPADITLLQNLATALQIGKGGTTP